MKFPKFGIGTWNMVSSADFKSILHAVLPLGVRLIDTAQWYANEHLIAEAMEAVLPEHNLKREDMIIATKVHPDNHGYENTLKSTRASIAHFGYVDLMLVHWPGMEDTGGQDIRVLRAGTWRALEELQTEGVLKSIGVSNYTVEHMQELLGYSKILPAVLQSEFHPRLHNSEIREFCEKEGIQFMGYCPLGRVDIMEKQLVQEIAHRNSLTTSQVLLKWGMQKGAIVIPKSSKAERNVENTKSWTDGILLSQADMDSIDTLEDGHRYEWNPYDLSVSYR